MIKAALGVVLGLLGLTKIIDTFLPGDPLTNALISGIWGTLQLLIDPLVHVCNLIFDTFLSLIRSFFF